MNNLTPRKIVLGLLLTLVLALSVQDIADALTLTRVSDEYQSKRLGSSFEITFSVGLTSPAIAYNSARKRVSHDYDDQTPLGTDHTATISRTTGRIDSSGYRVYDATNGREYRHSAAATALSVDLFVDPRPRYEFVSGNDGTRSVGAPATGGTATRGADNSGSGTDDLYVNNSGQVVDATGKVVYTRTGAGTRADTATNTENEPFVYTPVGKQNPDAPIAEPLRFDFNQESISVASNPSANITITDARDGQPPTGTPATISETTHFAQLRNRMTLDCDITEVGTYVITIADTTANVDFPARQVPSRKQSITFTLYVTAQAPTLIVGTHGITASTQRVDTGQAKESVSGRFAVSPDADTVPTETDPIGGNLQVRYRVVEGNGTLYVGNEELTQGSPTKDLTVHRSTSVWLNTNNTTNKVTATLQGGDPNVNTFRASIVFEYTGSDRRTTTISTTTIPDTTTLTPTTNTITFTPSTLSGETGEVVQLTLSPSTIDFTITGVGNFALAGGLIPVTGNPRSIRLPTTAGSYELTVRATTATGYTPVTVPVAVRTAAPSGGTPETPTTGTLSVSGPITGAPGTAVAVTVRARSANAAVGNLTIGLRADATIGTLAQTSVITNANGVASTVLTLSSTPGATGFVRAFVSGYIDNGGRRFTVSSTGGSSQPPQTGGTTPPQTQTPPVSEPSVIVIGGSAQRTGTVNEELDAPLLVRVLDAVGNAVADARVTFRVRNGRGRLSQRGNGRAIVVQTDSQGYGRANYTPMSASSTVEAEVTGVRQTATFTIMTGAAPAPGTTTRDTGTDTTPGTISPVVHVGAAQRPPMLWIDGGAIYALVGASAQRFAPGVDNALNIAVGGGKVYWTEKTGESGGTINSANLNGSGVTELVSIYATPMGIAVDVPNSKLYWTNSRGRIQSANLDGSGITNVIPGGLEGAMDIALAGGNAYWTQGGNVRFVNLRGQKQIRNISTGTDTAGSLAIGGGKIYWTEMTGESGGTVNSANLNGTGAMQLASILAAPSGIAVDGSRSKLYWGNARGRIQSANLNGSGIQNVVTGLGSPGDMVLSNSISAPTGTPTTTTTTTASNKYDVNGDGTVDSKDVDAIIVAVAAKITDAKYDVNGDGTVDINDVIAVSANRDAGAAAAPTLLGTKLSTVEIDRLQEQIDLLVASNDRSPDAMRVLTYLQQLIVMARPEKTQLLANYPNPFNPETWIPYELATDTTVKITIYNTHGVVVRTLELGHQSAGYYTGRDRAAYWDGRNAFGEQVASGIYFYQFETDEMSSMRKMVILK